MVLLGDNYISKRLDELAQKLSPSLVSILEETAQKLLDYHPSILYVGFYTQSGIRLYSKGRKPEYSKMLDNPIINAVILTIMGGVMRIEKELKENLKDVTIRYQGHHLIITSLGTNRIFMVLLFKESPNEGLILYLVHTTAQEIEERLF